jgi:RNA polymerase sigma factor (sigma-70 family)
LACSCIVINRAVKGVLFLEDSEIIAMVKNGNADSFAEIIERYQQPIFRYLYRLTGDHATSQDLRQDTFIQAYQGIFKTEIKVSFKSWLYRIATNNALQFHRRRRVLSFLPLKENTGTDIPGAGKDNFEQTGMQIDIKDTLDKIPRDQRVCMVLHFVEGFKYQEIAVTLGISEEAVRKRIFRGSQEFKRLYSSEGVR